MKTLFHPSTGRGYANHGWLEAYHSFSFASWYDESKMGFGALRVLNDDRIAPAMGFGKHPHDNMEIITIPLSGQLRHRDSMGNEGLITHGEVQVMSAGTGIVHSEHNASAHEPLQLFQLWILPKQRDVSPRYDQRKFQFNDSPGLLHAVVSSLPTDNALAIHQDARISMGNFKAREVIHYPILQRGNGVYLMAVNGVLRTGEHELQSRDAVGVWDTAVLAIEVLQDAQVLLIDVPM